MVRPGGEVLVCAWAFEQKGTFHDFSEQDCHVEWQLAKRFRDDRSDTGFFLFLIFGLGCEGGGLCDAG